MVFCVLLTDYNYDNIIYYNLEMLFLFFELFYYLRLRILSKLPKKKQSKLVLVSRSPML